MQIAQDLSISGNAEVAADKSLLVGSIHLLDNAVLSTYKGSQIKITGNLDLGANTELNGTSKLCNGGSISGLGSIALGIQQQAYAEFSLSLPCEQKKTNTLGETSYELSN